MGATVYVLRSVLIDAGAGEFVRLVLCVLAGILVYVPLCAWRQPELLDEVRRLRRGRIRGVATGAPAPSQVAVDPTV